MPACRLQGERLLTRHLRRRGRDVTDWTIEQLQSSSPRDNAECKAQKCPFGAISERHRRKAPHYLQLDIEQVFTVRRNAGESVIVVGVDRRSEIDDLPSSTVRLCVADVQVQTAEATGSVGGEDDESLVRVHVRAPVVVFRVDR